MERRVTSHTEEEEMNQRRRLLTLARKGDQKAVESLFELYQVRVFSGDALKKKKLPTFPLPPSTGSSGRGISKAGKKMVKISKLSSETMAKPTPAILLQEEKKKSELLRKMSGKTKSSKLSPQKPKKGRPPSSKSTSKSGGLKKPVVTGKKKQKKSTLSARPARVKKK
jgi:hypothetical protein